MEQARKRKKYEKNPPCNLDVRALIVGSGISYGELAKAIYVSPPVLSSWLAHNLKDWQREEIMGGIERIKAERGKENEG